MIPLIPPLGKGISLVWSGLAPTLAQAATEENKTLVPKALTDSLSSGLGDGFGEFIPKLLAAIAIAFVGWVFAYLISTFIRGLLKKTQIDDRIASAVTGRPPEDVPAAKWVSTAVYYLILLLVAIAVLETLDLTVVSAPLNNLLNTVFGYLPRLLGAGILVAVAWAIATVVKTLVTRGLESFQLDDRLAENTGVDPRENSVRIHETLGNALYWFVFLLFLPSILNSLELNGLLAPVQSLIDQFLTAIPKVILAGIILGAGWLVAKIVRGIVTNLLAATGVDNLGRQMGLSSNPNTPGMSLSGLAGTIVYVLVLIPAAIAALNALDIDAISDPAISMLDQILDFIPLLLAAGVVLTVFYFIGRFLSDLVSNLLSSAGFDGVLDVLGLPEISAPSGADSTPPVSAYDPSVGTDPMATTLQTPSSNSKTPSEIVGLIVLVGVVLFGAVTATEILQLDQLTLIVRAIMEIAAQVLIGVLIFGIGVYIANLAFRLINSSSSKSSNMLAQAARISILAFVGAMALGQMGVAPNIVNLAFGLLLGAIAIAIALAFGLGGRDVAAKQLEEWRNELKK
ncbi:MAG: mechanosensitive ion channel [Cyanobacteria bacterium J06598_1]